MPALHSYQIALLGCFPFCNFYFQLCPPSGSIYTHCPFFFFPDTEFCSKYPFSLNVIFLSLLFTLFFSVSSPAVTLFCEHLNYQATFVCLCHFTVSNTSSFSHQLTSRCCSAGCGVLRALGWLLVLQLQHLSLQTGTSLGLKPHVHRK